MSFGRLKRWQLLLVADAVESPLTRSRIPWVAILLLLIGGAVAVYKTQYSVDHDPASAYDYGRPGRERLPKMTLLNHQSVMADLFGKPAIDVKTIGILVYDGVDTVEAVAPMVVFSELMSVKLEYVGVRAGRVHTRLMDIEVERSFDQIDQLDMLIVPGGEPRPWRRWLQCQGLSEWLVRMDGGTKLTAGIGNGRELLVSARVCCASTGERAIPSSREVLELVGFHGVARHVACNLAGNWRHTVPAGRDAGS